VRFIGGLIQIYQFIWSLEAHREQRLAWRDATEARRARIIAEARAQAQHQAMMKANPSGQLGSSALGTREALEKGGLL
jgi:hypothetical protein